MSTQQQRLGEYAEDQEIPEEWRDLNAAQLRNRGYVEDGERAAEIAHGGQQ
jgi:hypothetical protein